MSACHVTDSNMTYSYKVLCPDDSLTDNYKSLTMESYSITVQKISPYRKLQKALIRFSVLNNNMLSISQIMWCVCHTGHGELAVTIKMIMY